MFTLTDVRDELRSELLHKQDEARGQTSHCFDADLDADPKARTAFVYTYEHVEDTRAVDWEEVHALHHDDVVEWLSYQPEIDRHADWSDEGLLPITGSQVIQGPAPDDYVASEVPALAALVQFVDETLGLIEERKLTHTEPRDHVAEASAEWHPMQVRPSGKGSKIQAWPTRAHQVASRVLTYPMDSERGRQVEAKRQAQLAAPTAQATYGHPHVELGRKAPKPAPAYRGGGSAYTPTRKLHTLSEWREEADKAYWIMQRRARARVARPTWAYRLALSRAANRVPRCPDADTLIDTRQFRRWGKRAVWMPAHHAVARLRHWLDAKANGRNWIPREEQ